MSVPEGWEQASIQDLISDKRITHHSDGNHGNLYPNEEDFSSHGVPYISAAAIINGEVVRGKFKYLKYSKAALLTKGKAKNGDVLFAHNASVGAVAKLELQEEFAFLSTSLTLFRSNEALLSSEYLKQFMQAGFFVAQYESVMKQSTRNQVPILTQRKLNILLPPLPEQRHIATILSQWDDSLSILAKLIEAKRQQKRGLAEQLLTGTRRLKGFGGEWEEKALGAFLQESRVPGSDGAKARKITVKLWGKGVYEKQEKLLGSENTKYFRRRAGQLIYSKLDFLNGAFGIVPKELDGLESTLDLPCFDFLNGLDPNFLLEYISRADFYSRFESGAIGGRIARRVTPDEFLKTQVLLPPLPEQQAIASILSTLDDEIATLNALKAKVQEQKRGLMDLLLTGKVRVKVEEV